MQRNILLLGLTVTAQAVVYMTTLKPSAAMTTSQDLQADRAALTVFGANSAADE